MQTAVETFVTMCTVHVKVNVLLHAVFLNASIVRTRRHRINKMSDNKKAKWACASFCHDRNSICLKRRGRVPQDGTIDSHFFYKSAVLMMLHI
jgi:hypothetical protein